MPTETETVSIIHHNDGIRFYWPGGGLSIFSNTVALAEAHAQERRKRHHAKQHLTGPATDAFSRLAGATKDNPELKALVNELGEELLEVGRRLEDVR